jgi:hypothetical protein
LKNYTSLHRQLSRFDTFVIGAVTHGGAKPPKKGELIHGKIFNALTMTNPFRAVVCTMPKR